MLKCVQDRLTIIASLSLSLRPLDGKSGPVTVVRKWPDWGPSFVFPSAVPDKIITSYSRVEPIDVEWQAWGRDGRSGTQVATIPALRKQISTD
ncbi:MAG TPA: hypothetical protein VEB61_11900 [Candidatus Binatia bacterium]|nr:hypothetical protein [Candidatus Binatia bacterium]